MKKIVVPVDFSQDSIRALEKAIMVAGRTDAEIALVHVIKVRSFATLFGSAVTTESEEDVLTNFKELLNKIDSKGIRISYYVRKGTVSKEIISFAEEHEAFLIVMGTHGMSGFEEFWAGSNAYRVVTNADCPVLTMRGTGDLKGITKIVLPLDTTTSTRHKVPFTAELAKIFNAKVYVLSVCLDDSEEFVLRLNSYGAQTCRYLNEQGVENDYDIVTGDNITDMTIEYAKKIDADLIAIMTEQETSVMNNFLGPYAQQMVNHSPIPVLSMHKNHLLEGNYKW